MKLGAYTACLHDKTLAESLGLLAELGLKSIEVNAGGFIPAPHIHVDALMASEHARKEYLAQIADFGIELTALNVNGNPSIAVNIEHEDTELGQLEGLSVAAEKLTEAAKALP